MEDGPNMNPSGTQGTLLTNTNTDTKSYNDIMTRRLKNRERQRRYRARKRLEADMQKSHVLSQPTLPKVESQLNGTFNNGTARVYCKRDWKKDARRAHIFKGQDTLNASIQSTLDTTVESQISHLPPGIRDEGSAGRECNLENSGNLHNSETRKPKLGRRDWKADARMKKS
ncbi:hydroxyproline-rich glycoprotein [Hibiscus syriacus]|uniref:Hydroxyproline-rich glycoprotein n=1 Tax=Hibiscus syriacus TaxID=106335 RepID=A0A6A3BCL2_HIBSY|nr:uncharacterized protein LOC120113405 [Hibiscus syriacus]KAE8713771.1 hydroxyproline-rich glycoprotein [Hibiscus syriacus]